MYGFSYVFKPSGNKFQVILVSWFISFLLGSLLVMQDQRDSSFIEALRHNYGKPPSESKQLPLHNVFIYWKSLRIVDVEQESKQNSR